MDTPFIETIMASEYRDIGIIIANGLGDFRLFGKNFLDCWRSWDFSKRKLNNFNGLRLETLKSYIYTT